MKYRLFRSFIDVINPSISKKNISDYEIIMDEDILPAYIYYPIKTIEYQKIIVYIPNKIKNSTIYKNLATATGNMVIVMKLEDSDIEKCHSFLKYIYDVIKTTKISSQDIIIMSDYEKCELASKLLMEKDLKIEKTIMVEPNEDIADKYINNKKVLIINGVDSKYHNEKIKEINSYLGGFIDGDNLAASESVYSLIKDFTK